MRIVVFNPIITRSTLPAILKCEQEKDVFMPASDGLSSQRSTSISVNGWYEIIGTNELGNTIWVYNMVEHKESNS